MPRSESSIHPLVALARQVWVRMLRWRVSRGPLQRSPRAITGWADLERILVKRRYGAAWAAQNPAASGLARVARTGASPHALMWRIACDELRTLDLGNLPVTDRRTSGAGAGRNRRRRYVELPIDAVAIGEEVCPGSRDWLVSPLWWLVGPHEIAVGEVRLCIVESLRALGLVCPSLDERRAFMSEEEHVALTAMPREETLARYRERMIPIVTRCEPAAIALAAELVRESWIDDQQDLLDIHRELACIAFDQWLKVPLVAEIEKALREGVLLPLLLGWPTPLGPATDPRVHPIPREEWIRLLETIMPRPVELIDMPYGLEYVLRPCASRKKRRRSDDPQ